MLELVKRLINEVNQECFNNELVINFPIEICNTARTAAYISHTKKNIFNPTMKVVKFAVSKNYQWTEDVLRSVVAHELIHVYVIQKLNIKDCHGPYFKAKMAEINKNTKYHVTIRHTMKTTKEQTRTVRSSLVYFIANREKNKITFLNKHPERLAHKSDLIQNYGNDYQIGTINSDKISKYYRVARKLKYSYKTDPQKLALIGI